MNIFETILIKYPDIQNVSYWQTQYDGTPWDDDYDGLVWENIEIPKPTKSQIKAWQKQDGVVSEWQKQQNEIKNATLYEQLKEIDMSSIRALRTNDAAKLAELEEQAVLIRAELL